MNHIRSVRRVKRRSDLGEDEERSLEGKGSSPEPCRQIFAQQILEHDVRCTARQDIEVERFNDVGMLEAGNDLGFLAKSFERNWIGRSFWRENFDRNALGKPQMTSLPDLTHATAADGSNQFIAVADPHSRH